MPGIIAGLGGGIALGLYLIATIVIVSHSATLVVFYQFVASGAIGPAAYRQGSTGAFLGLCVHFAVSVAWGIGYAYLAAQLPQLRSRPIISGIAFGLLVMVAMQLVEVAANIYRIPDATALINGIIAHTLFFGLPVALVVSRTLKPA